MISLFVSWNGEFGLNCTQFRIWKWLINGSGLAFQLPNSLFGGWSLDFRLPRDNPADDVGGIRCVHWHYATTISYDLRECRCVATIFRPRCLLGFLFSLGAARGLSATIVVVPQRNSFADEFHSPPWQFNFVVPGPISHTFLHFYRNALCHKTFQIHRGEAG